MKTEEEIVEEIISKHKSWLQKKMQLSEVEKCLIEAIQQTKAKLKEDIENLPNPYPKDVFPEVNFYQLEQVEELCNNLGFPLDRLSAHLMRIARENIKQELLKSLEEKW